VTALLRLVEELPNELMTIDGAEYNRLVLSVSTMRSTLDLQDWVSRGPGGLL
jgi:hypothetical protein